MDTLPNSPINAENSLGADPDPRDPKLDTLSVKVKDATVDKLCLEAFTDCCNNHPEKCTNDKTMDSCYVGDKDNIASWQFAVCTDYYACTPGDTTCKAEVDKEQEDRTNQAPSITGDKAYCGVDPSPEQLQLKFTYGSDNTITEIHDCKGTFVWKKSTPNPPDTKCKG